MDLKSLNVKYLPFGIIEPYSSDWSWWNGVDHLLSIVADHPTFL